MKHILRSESAQATVFFAVVLPLMILVLGLVLEAGNIFAQYRQMQSAADMAALVGAQNLPCATSDSSCISTAETTACTYASSNGYSGCAAHGSSGSLARVPPLTCSPYDFIDYGNNSSCGVTGAQTQTSYSYIEVQIQKQLTVPIFGFSVNLDAHAVARNGQSSSKDYAIAVLDPTQSRALDLSGSQSGGLVVVGPVVSNSTASDSIYSGGQSTQITCDGQWYTAANESAPAGITSNTGGTTWFAPPLCNGGSTDSPTRFLANSPPIDDPFANSTVPTGTGSNSMTNCTPCMSAGVTYSWSSGHRYDGTGSWNTTGADPHLTNSSNVEFFPGIYSNGITIGGGYAYFNPGVYTLKGDFKVTGGTLCVFGAPACDHQLNTAPTALTDSAHASSSSEPTCADASFRTGDSTYVASGEWYYFCSPWGYWDTAPLPNRPITTTAPTYADNDSSATLNGVTFYMQSGNFNLSGNVNSFIAFPNPCPGTGTSSANSVSFGIAGTTGNGGAGSTSGVYNYPQGSLVYADSQAYPSLGLQTSQPGQVYPNTDMSYTEDQACRASIGSSRTVWPGEFGSGGQTQHLHFVIFQRDGSHGVTLNGTGLENWWGIIYNPGVSGCGNACTVQINGGGGSGTGPPLLTGQVIADNATFGGNAAFEIFYRACHPNGDPCGYGPGTSLVQ